MAQTVTWDCASGLWGNAGGLWGGLWEYRTIYPVFSSYALNPKGLYTLANARNWAKQLWILKRGSASLVRHT